MTSRIALVAVAAIWVLSAKVPALAHDDHAHAGGVTHGGTSTDGAPGKPENAKRTVSIEATDNAFNVKQIPVMAGETVRFVISNSGFNTHEFAIASRLENEEHRAMMRQMPHMVHNDPNVVTIEPGETKELVWRFGKDRNVEFPCNIRDHAEEGMRGAFRVTR
jgi:uncharacterized cupredoxin-like copper-binding protein